MYNSKDWTYGAEHELGDWDTRLGVPEGFGIDRNDITCMSSNGIANDPSGKIYPYGGEINTPPTADPQGQLIALNMIKTMHRYVSVNHRSNLHIHIRVPGLKNDLPMLKKLAMFVSDTMPALLPKIEPIPRPKLEDFEVRADFEAAVRRFRRRRISHHTVIKRSRVEAQQNAATLEEFFAGEVAVARKTGRPQWHLQPRAAVNIRQLLQTDTIEFRHFPGTLDEKQLLSCVLWCKGYLECFFKQQDPMNLYLANEWNFPQFPEFVPWMEKRYRATVHDGTLTPEQINKNIMLIEKGEFDDKDPRFVPCQSVPQSSCDCGATCEHSG